MHPPGCWWLWCKVLEIHRGRRRCYWWGQDHCECLAFVGEEQICELHSVLLLCRKTAGINSVVTSVCLWAACSRWTLDHLSCDSGWTYYNRPQSAQLSWSLLSSSVKHEGNLIDFTHDYYYFFVGFLNEFHWGIKAFQACQRSAGSKHKKSLTELVSYHVFKMHFETAQSKKEIRILKLFSFEKKILTSQKVFALKHFSS